MSTKRSYQDGCAAAHALDLIGERWAILVVRELLLGPRRFTDLRTSLPTISPNVLSQRLNELEESGIVQRRKLAPPANVWIYELSDWGLELEPVIIQLGRWGARSPLLCQEGALSVVSLMLSFKAMLDPNKAQDLKASYEIRLGEDHFHVHIREARLKVSRGKAEHPDAVIETSAKTLAALIYMGHSLDEALQAGELSYQGSRSAIERFITLFSLPQPAFIQQP